MSKRENVTITVFNGVQYDGDWPTPSGLVNAIAWFQEKLTEIPEEYRECARCEIDSASDYEGSHYGHIEISYERPETDEEMAERIARHQARKAAVEAHERATLNALKTKYEGR